MTALAIPADLQPVEPAYRSALRARAAIFWVPVFIAALVVDRSCPGDHAFRQPAAGAGRRDRRLAAIMVAPDRIYRRLGYAIDGRLLRTRPRLAVPHRHRRPVRPGPAYRRHPRPGRQVVRHRQPGRPHRRHPQQRRRPARPVAGARRRDPRRDPLAKSAPTPNERGGRPWRIAGPARPARAASSALSADRPRPVAEEAPGACSPAARISLHRAAGGSSAVDGVGFVVLSIGRAVPALAEARISGRSA